MDKNTRNMMRMSTPTSFWFCCSYAEKWNVGKAYPRLLPKKKNREPFGLLILQVGSPSHNVGSPHKKKYIININFKIATLDALAMKIHTKLKYYADVQFETQEVANKFLSTSSRFSGHNF